MWIWKGKYGYNSPREAKQAKRLSRRLSPNDVVQVEPHSSSERERQAGKKKNIHLQLNPDLLSSLIHHRQHKIIVRCCESVCRYQRVPNAAKLVLSPTGGKMSFVHKSRNGWLARKQSWRTELIRKRRQSSVEHMKKKYIFIYLMRSCCHAGYFLTV